VLVYQPHQENHESWLLYYMQMLTAASSVELHNWSNNREVIDHNVMYPTAIAADNTSTGTLLLI
jgi:hypothetical protein